MKIDTWRERAVATYGEGLSETTYKNVGWNFVLAENEELRVRVVELEARPPAVLAQELEAALDALRNIRDYRTDVNSSIAARSMRFHAEQALIAPTVADIKCRPNEFSSRACEAGTKGCVISHHVAPVRSEGLEAIQWRNIQKVIKELADFCFGGARALGNVSTGAAYVAMTTALTAKDGLNVSLEPLASTQTERIEYLEKHLAIMDGMARKAEAVLMNIGYSISENGDWTRTSDASPRPEEPYAQIDSHLSKLTDFSFSAVDPSTLALADEAVAVCSVASIQATKGLRITAPDPLAPNIQDVETGQNVAVVIDETVCATMVSAYNLAASPDAGASRESRQFPRVERWWPAARANEKVTEPDWSNSKTLESEVWKNPLLPMPERLQIADGAVRFRNDVIANLRAQLAQVKPGLPSETFQQRVLPWMLECFGAEISADLKERNHRFLEEALELVQSGDCTAEEAHRLVDYVFNRPVGEKSQEVGGVMVTLAAWCLAQELSMHGCGETELTRIWTKVEQIRAKQAAKPKFSTTT